MYMESKTNDFFSKVAVANQSGAMEAGTISKNGRSSKSLTSRRNLIVICLIIFGLGGFYSCGEPTIVSVCEVLTTPMFEVKVMDMNHTKSGLILKVKYRNTDNESRFLFGAGQLFFELNDNEYTFEFDEDYDPTPSEIFTDEFNPFATITFRVRFKVPKEMYSASCYYIPARYDETDYRIFLGTINSLTNCSNNENINE